MFLNLFYYLGVKQTRKREGGDMMLKDLTDEKLIRLNIEAADWEEAIRKSAQPLIDEHKVKPSYVDDMITGVKENGPYIVLTKHVALPHARPESGANDPVKYLFCLSAKDNMEHLNALAELAGMFEDAQFYRLLEHAESAKEIMEYISK